MAYRNEDDRRDERGPFENRDRGSERGYVYGRSGEGRSGSSRGGEGRDAFSDFYDDREARWAGFREERERAAEQRGERQGGQRSASGDRGRDPYWDERGRSIGVGGTYGGSHTYGGVYGPARGDRYGRGDDRGREDRSMWDRTRDEVSSWFGDDDAQRRRIEDDHRGRGPKGYARSDDRIREDVSDRLSDDRWVDASDIEVSVASCEVTLSGTVSSREARRRAEDCAESVSGVVHVQNNLRVKREGADALIGATGAGVTAGVAPASGSRPTGDTRKDGGRH